MSEHLKFNKLHSKITIQYIYNKCLLRNDGVILDYRKYFDKMENGSYTFNDKNEFMQFSREIMKLYRSLNYRINKSYQVYKNRKIISPYLFFPVHIRYEFYEKRATRFLNVKAIQIIKEDNRYTIIDILKNKLVIDITLEKIGKTYKILKPELRGMIFNYSKNQFFKLISTFDKVYKNDITVNIITPFIGWDILGNEYNYYPCHAELKDRYLIGQNKLFLKVMIMSI